MPPLSYFDCPSGASGDMILGALVDAGLSVDALRKGLRTLPLGGWDLTARQVVKESVRATKVDVTIDDAAHHEHRTLADVLAILRGGALPSPVLMRAEQIFTRLADAEARAHGTSREAVQFHDVGAVDAIIDVTGSVLGLHLLDVDTVTISALPIGGGFVDGPHGRFPVPGPGTAELLRGFPVVDTGVRAELVTPTGAAILTTLCVAAGSMPAITVRAVGYGAGTRDLPGTPNILRCLIGDPTDERDRSSTEARDRSTAEGRQAIARHGASTVTQLEATIDDMSPQLYEPLTDALFAAGALDVFLTPVVMKRGRPGTVVTALCPPDRVGALTRVLFTESTTIGVRFSERRRATLERESIPVTTVYGVVSVKVSRLDGRVVTATPEFADVVRLARAKSVAVREVLDQARADARRLLDSPPG